MSISNVSAGDRVPHEFNVIIEIPVHADPVKYEVDKETGALFVDRFMSTSMHFPGELRLRAAHHRRRQRPGRRAGAHAVCAGAGSRGALSSLGMLRMDDESGGDAKLFAVPTDATCPQFAHWKSIDDVPEIRLKQMQHFFEHYKDLEAGKWVKVIGWVGIDAAHAEILSGLKRYAEQVDRRTGVDRRTAG